MSIRNYAAGVARFFQGAASRLADLKNKATGIKTSLKNKASQMNPYNLATKRDEAAVTSVTKGENVGIYLDFFTWNIFVRPAASIGAGAFLATMTWLLDALVGADLIDFWLWLALTALFGYWVGKGEKDVESVPEGRIAMVSWFGIPLRVYRQTGEYAWTGKNFRLGRIKTVKEPMTDGQGFFWTDAVQVNIWNVYESVAAKRTNLLEAVTKSGSEIKANLLLMLKMRDPMLWIRKTDPMMDIGERARMSFRTAVSFFTGKDVVSVKNLLTEMMSGHVVLTCFIKEQVGTLAKHSLIRDNGGDPMYESIRINAGESEDNERREFLEKLKSQADKTLLAKVGTEAGEPLVEKREISESLEEVLHACGITLERASVGFIGLPDEVVKAANQADAQPYQLATQRASAQAAKEARDLLRPEQADIDDPTFADRQAFAAASDPDSRVEVIHVSGGGDGLGKAAAIVANAIKKGNKR